MKIICEHCGKESDKPVGAVNRAKSIKAPLYCDKKCAGLGRRTHKTKAQKVKEKRAYDAKRRIDKRAELKAWKGKYHKRTYDPVKAAADRKKKMPAHIEYCRQPEYKKYKADYDRKRRYAKRDEIKRLYIFGPVNPQGEQQWINKSRALLRTAKRLLTKQTNREVSQLVKKAFAPERTSPT